MSSYSVSPCRSYSRQTEHRGISMTLIGVWSDLAAYYSGSDGNVWAFQMHWANLGPESEFRDRLAAGRIRGKLI